MKPGEYNPNYHNSNSYYGPIHGGLNRNEVGDSKNQKRDKKWLCLGRCRWTEPVIQSIMSTPMKITTCRWWGALLLLSLSWIRRCCKMRLFSRDRRAFILHVPMMRSGDQASEPSVCSNQGTGKTDINQQSRCQLKPEWYEEGRVAAESCFTGVLRTELWMSMTTVSCAAWVKASLDGQQPAEPPWSEHFLVPDGRIWRALFQWLIIFSRSMSWKMKTLVWKKRSQGHWERLVVERHEIWRWMSWSYRDAYTEWFLQEKVRMVKDELESYRKRVLNSTCRLWCDVRCSLKIFRNATFPYRRSTVHWSRPR